MVSITKTGAFRDRQKFRTFIRRALRLSSNQETQIYITVTLFDTFKVIQHTISDSDDNFTFSKDESFYIYFFIIVV